MYKINQIKISSNIPIARHSEEINKRVIKKLNISQNQVKNITILKRSIDARKDVVNYIYSVTADVNGNVKINPKDSDISIYQENNYVFPDIINKDTKTNPVIIGLGPAGLFCGYMLAKHGFRPLIFERGKCVEERTADVENFWKTGILDTASNVQFGEGGAGTFSDGKLNTLVKDKSGKNREVLKILVENGAPEEILYDSKPHIGTDLLKEVVKNISKYIVNNGGVIKYNSKVDNFEFENNKITAVYCNGQRYESNNVVLAIGHSARDTFELINDLGISMEAKPFAVGYRVMHPQSIIDDNQYGENYNKQLPASSYKVTSNFERGVYSFCMCPGGYVVNASSEEKRLAVNGMSYHKRDSGVANSAIIVQVTPKDYQSSDALSGVRWQRALEERAYELAKGKIPLQRYGEFKFNVLGEKIEKPVLNFSPMCKGDFEYCDVNSILPNNLNKNFIQGMEYFGGKIKHFNDSNVILAGVESRTSSPVRIVRDENGESSIKGLYPCGEGAGYAGGITSAAMDGIYIAERIAIKEN